MQRGPGGGGSVAEMAVGPDVGTFLGIHTNPIPDHRVQRAALHKTLNSFIMTSPPLPLDPITRALSFAWRKRTDPLPLPTSCPRVSTLSSLLSPSPTPARSRPSGTAGHIFHSHLVSSRLSRSPTLISRLPTPLALAPRGSFRLLSSPTVSIFCLVPSPSTIDYRQPRTFFTKTLSPS